ncbi:MAG: very short patch repair endonuclease [Firmicutes bacterium]|nr:very short patch repair endonuclease [Bacillota bacterium]
MSDIFNRQKRSEVMSAIRGKENKTTEFRLIKLFKELKIAGWRRHYKIKGKPDFVFLKGKIAIFADGCFWHGHDCRNVTPADNKDFWDKKIMANKVRDIAINEYLESRGWQVVRIWECELKKKTEHIAKAKINGVLFNNVPLC